MLASGRPYPQSSPWLTYALVTRLLLPVTRDFFFRSARHIAPVIPMSRMNSLVRISSGEHPRTHHGGIEGAQTHLPAGLLVQKVRRDADGIDGQTAAARDPV